MPRPARRKRNVITDQQRYKFVELVVSRGSTKADVAKRFSLPYSTVATIINKFERTGTIEAQQKKGAAFRGSIVTDEVIERIMAFVGLHPASTLVEIQEHLDANGGPHLSTTTLQRTLKDRCHLTLKRLHVDHERYNNESTIAERKKWVQDFRVGGRSFEEAVFLDEAGFNLHSKRSVGRSTAGIWAQQQRRPADRKTNMSLMVAVGKEGLIAADIIIGSWNSDYFVDFLEDHLLPYIRNQKRLFIMDNARFHKTDDVIQCIKRAGHEPFFLPPYSPWLNISKRVFAKVKPIVSRQELTDHKTLGETINSQLAHITADDCLGWLRESTRWMIAAKHGHALGPEHDARDALARLGLLPDHRPSSSNDAEGESYISPTPSSLLHSLSPEL